MYRPFFNATQNLQQEYNKSSNIHQHQQQHNHHHHHQHPMGNISHLSNGSGGSGAYYNLMSSNPIGFDTNSNLRISTNSSNRMKQYGSTMSDQFMGGSNGYGVLCSGGIGNGSINRQNNISVAACAAATAAAAAAVAHNRQNGYQLKVGGRLIIN